MGQTRAKIAQHRSSQRAMITRLIAVFALAELCAVAWWFVYYQGPDYLGDQMEVLKVQALAISPMVAIPLLYEAFWRPLKISSSSTITSFDRWPCSSTSGVLLSPTIILAADARCNLTILVL